MSSPGLPTLNLDVRARRAERLVAVSILVATVAGMSLLERPTAAIVLVSLCAAAILALGFRLIGWIDGPRRLTRIACQPDGLWELIEAGGRTSQARLSPASRVTPFVLWLEWSGRAGRPLLLLQGDVPSVEFRRLVVRLRLCDRLIPAGADDES
jgi:hypothetical protein